MPASVQGCLIGVALVFGSCGRVEPPPREAVVVWRNLGSWSGVGPTQTDPFISETGSLRLRWETHPTPDAGGKQRSGSSGDLQGSRVTDGRFRVVVHSDVSGRSLGTAIDVSGAGRDTVYFNEDPRPFFFAVESERLAWTLVVDEPVAATGPASR